jgi:HflC protein
MNVSKKTAIFIAAAAVILLVLVDAVYVVSETDQVIITQFGEPIGGAISTAGIHIKMPFIQKTNFFEKRWLEWDGFPNQIPTKDKKYIWVDTYARWRISEPLIFYQRVRDERGAQSRLDDVIDGETRNVIANFDLIEVVRSSNREFERRFSKPRPKWLKSKWAGKSWPRWSWSGPPKSPPNSGSRSGMSGSRGSIISMRSSRKCSTG